MRKSHVVAFVAVAAFSMPLVGAAELLDAPGPGYHQQSERLTPSRHQPVASRFSPSIQIYHAIGAFSTESLSIMEQAFSRADRLIQSARRSAEPEASGTLKQQAAGAALESVK